METMILIAAPGKTAQDPNQPDADRHITPEAIVELSENPGRSQLYDFVMKRSITSQEIEARHSPRLRALETAMAIFTGALTFRGDRSIYTTPEGIHEFKEKLSARSGVWIHSDISLDYTGCKVDLPTLKKAPAKFFRAWVTYPYHSRISIDTEWTQEQTPYIELIKNGKQCLKEIIRGHAMGMGKLALLIPSPGIAEALSIAAVSAGRQLPASLDQIGGPFKPGDYASINLKWTGFGEYAIWDRGKREYPIDVRALST